MTAYKTHGCIRRTPISAEQIKANKNFIIFKGKKTKENKAIITIEQNNTVTNEILSSSNP